MTENTHAVSTPNKRPLTAIEQVKVAMFGEYQKQIVNYYAGSEPEAMRFMTAAVEYVRRVPKLLECDRTSLLMALIQSAQFRFMPSGVSGEAYIIPYNREAKFQIGYQGIVTLLYRAGVESITANIVYFNDAFEYEAGLESRLIHKPTKFGVDRGKPVGVYTVVQNKGVKTFKVMAANEVLAIKDMSKAKDSKESPWNSKDPELWMWKKTCLIQHAKLLPKTQELQQAIEKDYEGEGLDKGKLDAGGPAVPKAFHAPEAPLSEDEQFAANKEKKGDE